jgi:tripartite ATP-independent transporter DctM subunit
LLRTVIALSVAAFAGLFVYVEVTLYLPLRMSISLPASGLPQGLFSIPAMVGMGVIAVSSFCDSLNVDLKRWAGAALITACISVAVFIFAQSAESHLGLHPLVVPWLLFGIFLLCGFPIAFAMAIGGLSYLILLPDLPLFRLVQQIENGVDSTFLLTIPLFVLTGKLLEVTSVSDRLLSLVKVFIGRIRGGIGVVSIGGMYLFTGISGSPTADISAVGSVMAPAMRREGYSEGEAVGIISAATIMGHTNPMSIALIVLAQLAGLSIGTLFIAGILPALFLAGVLSVYILFSAYRQKLERSAALTMRDRLRILARGLPALTVPAVLFGGLFSGLATPTEVAGLAVLASLAVAGLFLRELTLRSLVNAAIEAAALTGMALLLLATANLLAFSSVDQQLPQMITEFVQAFAKERWEFLLLSLVVLVLMGAILEFPALLIFGPLMLPVAVALGFHPMHYAIFLINAVFIGCFLPPIGVLYYVTCGIASARSDKAAGQTLIYLAIVSVSMLCVGFFPWFTLALPRALGLIH